MTAITAVQLLRTDTNVIMAIIDRNPNLHHLLKTNTGRRFRVTWIRHKIVLDLLTGAGLRRDELANLKFGDIVLQLIAGKFRTLRK